MDQLAAFAPFFSALAYKGTGEWKEEIVYFDATKLIVTTAALPDGTPVTAPDATPEVINTHLATIDGLPPLREVITSYDLVAKRQLGQNFLLDLNLTAKIARSAGDLSTCDVLEVGPGPGGLTRGLLIEGARRVLAVEKDPRNDALPSTKGAL